MSEQEQEAAWASEGGGRGPTLSLFSHSSLAAYLLVEEMVSSGFTATDA